MTLQDSLVLQQEDRSDSKYVMVLVDVKSPFISDYASVFILLCSQAL